MRSPLSKCKNCGLYESSTLTCKIFKTNINPEEPGCPYFAKNKIICDYCGKIIVKPRDALIEQFNDISISLCDKCNTQINSCSFCSFGTTCDFNTNPINLPKVVQKQVRQGYTIMTTQIKNPAREAETCAKNCKCWDPINQTCNKEGEVKWCESYCRKH